MILADDAGGASSKIDHSPWNGCTLADFIMPFFLFIAEVAIALALEVTGQAASPASMIGICFSKFIILHWKPK